MKMKRACPLNRTKAATIWTKTSHATPIVKRTVILTKWGISIKWFIQARGTGKRITKSSLTMPRYAMRSLLDPIVTKTKNKHYKTNKMTSKSNWHRNLGMTFFRINWKVYRVRTKWWDHQSSTMITRQPVRLLMWGTDLEAKSNNLFKWVHRIQMARVKNNLKWKLQVLELWVANRASPQIKFHIRD